MLKKGKKTNNGITLIALVITIIVLLILAGVSIAMLTGDNGILTKATESKTKTEEAEAREKVELEVMGSYGTDGKIDIGKLNENLGKVEGLTSGLPISSLPADVVVDGYKVTINADGSVSVGNNAGGDIEEDIAGKTFDADEDIEVGGVPVTIPAGATVSGIKGEYENVDDGFVIYITNGDTITDWNADTNKNEIKDVQENYDQFVWVPVEKAYVTTDEIGGDSYTNLKNYVSTNGIYPMAIEVREGTYKGILYDFADGTDAAIPTPKDYTTPSGYREPAFLTSSSYADGSSYNNVGITQDPDSLQIEFNTMVTRVAGKKGFWVGRYETSHMVSDSSQDTTNEIKVIKGTTEGINNVNWYRMYAQQKAYKANVLAESENVTSSMIWGSQWDQIMIWMKSIPSKYTDTTYTGKFYVTNAVGMGNYGGISGVDDGWSSSSPALTGYSESYKVKNIFDLAGNVNDWTLEAYNPSGRVIRRRRLQWYQ